MLAPPQRVGAPSYRESWIRPWRGICEGGMHAGEMPIEVDGTHPTGMHLVWHDFTENCMKMKELDRILASPWIRQCISFSFPERIKFTF